MKGYPSFFVNEFHWDPKRRSFTAEASELKLAPGEEPFGRLYTDACDAGLHLINTKTRKALVLVLTSVEHSADFGVTFWQFEPTRQDIEKNYKLKDLTLKVFND